MKVGVENHWRLDGIKIPSSRTRTKMLASFESHRFDLVYIFATRLEPAKFITEMQAFFWQFFFASPKSLGRFVKKSTKNSMELTSVRREQGRRC